MSLEKLLSEGRTIKELNNGGLKYQNSHEGFKIFLDEKGQRYYFIKQDGLYQHHFHTTIKPKYNRVRY